MTEAIVVGDPTMPAVTSSGETRTLPRLPAAGVEAAWLAELIGATYLTGDQATETLIRSRLATAPLIHLATHGFSYSSICPPTWWCSAHAKLA